VAELANLVDGGFGSVESVGGAIAGEVVRLVSDGDYAPAQADSRANASGLAGVWDGSRVRTSGDEVLASFDGVPARGPCYLSSSVAGALTCGPTVHLTMPRYMGRVTRVVDSSHARVRLQVVPPSLTDSFTIFDYPIPAVGLQGVLVIPFVVSSKFSYKVKATYQGTQATALRLQVQQLNTGGSHYILGSGAGGLASDNDGVKFALSAGVGAIEAEATIEPRGLGSSLVHASSFAAPKDATYFAATAGAFSLDFTQLGFYFDYTAVAGRLTVNQFDPMGVG
jgi:hypothetical protein